MSETTAQKTARLRALRYARDGSPDERKAAAKARVELKEKVRVAAINMYFDALHSAVKREDDSAFYQLTGIKLPPKC